MVTLALHRLALPAVVNERVNSLLEHSLFIADHQARRPHTGKALETVVPGQHTAIQVVQVAGGEPSAVQLDHGAQLRRQHRQDGHDHVLHPVLAAAEGFQQAHALARLGPDLRRGRPHLELGVISFLIQVRIQELEKLQDRLGAHIGIERLSPEGLEAIVAVGGEGREMQPGGPAARDVKLIGQLLIVAGRRRQLQIIPQPIQVGGARPLRRVPPGASASPGSGPRLRAAFPRWPAADNCQHWRSNRGPPAIAAGRS